MRKQLLLFGLIISLQTYSQISTTKVIEQKDETSEASYDSLKNFLGNDVYKYIGQELYLKGMSESLRKFGYRDFIKNYKYEGHYLKYEYIYKCCASNGQGSKYDQLNSKYFKVLDVYKHPKAETYGELYNYYYLKLQEKESNEILYFNYSPVFDISFPFIVVGFYEKLKKTAIGKKYVFATDRIDKETKDITTGKPIINNIGEIWECIDVTIDEKYFDLSLVLKNKIGQKIMFSYDIVTEINKWVGVFTINQSIKYKNKFGVANWNTILQGKVKIGMTKEMCKLSWGQPQDINETITSGRKSEQWVYSDNYLYFDNGVVTAMQ